MKWPLLHHLTLLMALTNTFSAWTTPISPGNETVLAGNASFTSCHLINDPVCSRPLNSRCNVLTRKCSCPLGTTLKSDHCQPMHCTSDELCNELSDYHMVCTNSSHPQHHVLGVHGDDDGKGPRGVCICNPAYFYPSMDGFACQLRQSIVAVITFTVIGLAGLIAAGLIYSLHEDCPCTEEDW